MSIKKIEIQDHQGNIYHPHTDAKVVFTSDGKTVEEGIQSLKLNVNNGKTVLATAIGAPIASTDTFAQIGVKIDTLKSTLAANNKSKGVDSNASETLKTLIDKVKDIVIEKHTNLPDWANLSNSYIYGSKLPNFSSDIKTHAIGNKIYVISSKSTDCYDTTTNTWSTKSKMPTARTATTSCVVGSKIYIIGGYLDSNYSVASKVNECYDTTTNTWSTKAQMPTERISAMSISLDNKIYVVGGRQYYYGGGTYDILVDNNECYDTNTNTWSTKSKISRVRTGSVICSYGDNIIIIGGLESHNSSTSETLIYNTIKNSWSDGVRFSSFLSSSSTQVNDKIYIFNSYNLTTNETSNSSYYIDLKTMQLTQIRDYPLALRFVSSSYVNEVIYCFGGSNPNNKIDTVIGYII